MSQDNSLPKTEPLIATPLPERDRSLRSRMLNLNFRLQSLKFPQKLSALGLEHFLAGGLALLAGTATLHPPVPVQFLERQAQTLFFNIRGPVKPPDNIVILAIDQATLNQARIDQTDSNHPQNLSNSSVWPFRRAVYAEVLERLMKAGARSVAVDVLWADPSSYSPEDDAQLQQVLQRYAGRITLAASYETTQIREGTLTQLTLPHGQLHSPAESIGSINFWTEPDNVWKEPDGAEGRIHRLGSQFPILLAQQQPDKAAYLQQMSNQYSSFAEAILKAAKLPVKPPQGDTIFYSGPSQGGVGNLGFQYVPFWYVLNSGNWNGYLKKGEFFKDKIVLIGTASDNTLKDYLSTPFGKMPGVEVHANAIATLQEGTAIADGLPNPWFQGGFVVALVLVAAYFQSRQSSPIRRFLVGMALTLAWGMLSYSIFVRGRLVLPAAVPMGAIALSGISYLLLGVVRENQRLIDVLREYLSFEVIRDFVEATKNPDLERVVNEYQPELIGHTLNGRYEMTRELGQGGFGQTYLARDLHIPGHPNCVVKRLKPTNTKPRAIELAHRLFNQEAEALRQLGNHDQIPQLLAYFQENNEFFLVQEYVDGQSLASELSLQRLLKTLPEQKVIIIVGELLEILKFVHQQGVIHRDIKPGNIIRRKGDGKVVLIDFGAVKQISLEIGDLGDTPAGPNRATVAIGTNGYMAPEQSRGAPCFGSDIFSVGIMAIEALSGTKASNLRFDPQTGWRTETKVSHTLAEILDKMTCLEIQDRYPSAADVLIDLQPLVDLARQNTSQSEYTNFSGSAIQENGELSALEETRPWPRTFGSDVRLPPTDANSKQNPTEQNPTE